MKPMVRNPAFGLASIVTFSTAGLVGWKLAERPPTGTVPSSAGEVSGKREVRSARHPRSAAADLAGRRMASIRLAGSPEARLRATVDLAYSLSPSEFAAWMDGGWFTVRGGPELTLFTKIVMERWKLEDETGLATWMLTKDNGYSQALTDLVKKDPQRVLDHFRENPGSGGTREMTALWALAKEHPDLALARMQEIVDSGRLREVQGYAGQLMQNLAEKDPAMLAAAVEGFPPGLKLQAEIALSGDRLKKSFSEEIHPLSDRPDGWKIFEANLSSVENVGDKILSELTSLPQSWRDELVSNSYYLIKKENAEKWLDVDLEAAGFSSTEIQRIRSRALLTMGAEDPDGALRRLDTLGMNASQRETFIRNFIGGMRDVDKAREFVSRLQIAEERDKAIRMLDQRRPPAESEVKVETPADWLAKAAGMDPAQGSIPYTMFSNLRQWDEEKMDTLAAGFRSMDAEKKPVVARVIVNSIGSYGRMSEGLAGDALRYLMENPAPRAEGGGRRDNVMEKSGTYVVQLSTRDPAAASDWVNSLPAGEAKTWTQRNLLNNWRQYDPKAADQWEKSLPATERDALEAIRQKQGN